MKRSLPLKKWSLSNRWGGTQKRVIARLTLVLVLAFVMFTFMIAPYPQTIVAQAATCVSYHTVVSGDTLSSLSLQYGTTVEEIAEANNLKPPYTIIIDQELCIPAGTGSSTTPAEDTTSSGTTTNTVSSSGPYFTVTFGENTVDLKTVSYPKNRTYYVNLYDGKMTSFYRLGLLSTRPTTTLQQTYQLPKSLRDAKSMVFCLKDVSLDNIQCITYILQSDGFQPGFTWTIRYTSAK